METLGTRIKKSGKGLSDQGVRFYSDTRAASKEFVTFVHTEARDWGEYLRLRYQHLGDQGRELLQQDRQLTPMWSHLDVLLTRIAHKAASEDESNDESKPAEDVSDDDAVPAEARDGDDEADDSTESEPEGDQDESDDEE